MTPERRRKLLGSSALGRAVLFGAPPEGDKGDLDPNGHWRTVAGQHLHITAAGDIDAGGHPELRKVLAEKAGLPAKSDAKPKPVAVESKPKKVVKPKTPTGPSHRTEATEGGVSFKTGVPVTFPMMRNLQPSPKLGKGQPDRYQQGVEPAGRYMLHDSAGQAEQGKLSPGWASEKVTFRNPLVVPLNTGGKGEIYGDDSWKMNLSREFNNKKGSSLSNAIAKAGHDGIVTVDGRGNTSEIIDLRHLHPTPTASAPLDNTPVAGNNSKAGGAATPKVHGKGAAVNNPFSGLTTSPGGKLSAAAAKIIADKFSEAGKFTKVEVHETGVYEGDTKGEAGDYEVHLWNINAQAGNRNLEVVKHVPANEREFKLLVKKALGKANDRDRAALGRIAAERNND